jgi:hypothetical protein
MSSSESQPRSAQDFYDGFISHPSPIQGQPTYADLNLLRTHLYKEAARVPSTLGGGACGHLGLIMDPALYTSVSATPWVTPVLPVLAPYAPNATGPAIAAANARYKADLKEYHEVKNLDLALTRLISKTIDAVYLGPLDQPFVGLINYTTRDILDWLIKHYGRILPHQAIANRQRLSEPWNASEPFQLLNDRFRQVTEFAHDYGVPVTDADLLTYGLYHIQNTGVLNLPVQQWQTKPPADRSTWRQFVDHFQPEVLEYQLTKPHHNQFAALATATFEASVQPILQCMDVKHQENHSALANLVATSNSTIAQQLLSLQKIVSDLKNQVQAPTGVGSSSGRSTASTAASSLTTSSAARPPRARRIPTDVGSYCWTHGYLVGRTHTSANCTNPRPGHQTNATRTNNLGGSQVGNPAST